jgi:hypothetical protein
MENQNLLTKVKDLISRELTDDFSKELKKNIEINQLFNNDKLLLKDIKFPNFKIEDTGDFTIYLRQFKNIEFINCDFYSEWLGLKDLNCCFLECNFLNKINITNINNLDGTNLFVNCVFENEIKFYGDEIISNLFEDCKIKKVYAEFTTFKGLIFDEIKEVENLHFVSCTFEQNFILNSKIIRSINFEKSEFRNKLKLINCEIKEKANFKRTKFNVLVGFEKTIFNEVIFRNTRFKKTARFIGTEFKENINFEYTYFDDIVAFNEVIVKENINLEKTIFFKSSNFHNIKCENIANRETARIIKDSFEQQNNIIEANKFYALEMREREKELSPKKDFFEWIVFKTHGLVSNHSQDWVLALFWIISLTFMTSFIKIIDSNIPQLSEKIVLSFIVTAIVFFININISNTKKIYYIICSSIYYILYSTFSKDFVLHVFSNTINPFSIMTGKEELTFGILLYKITIAYLIYQLIISIRQNTRRK